MAASKLLVRLKIDDPLDASPVHLFGGLWGVFSTSLFANQKYVTQVYHQGSDELTDVYGLFLGGGFGQVWVQLVGIIAIVLWAFGCSWILFQVLKKLHILRVEPETELAGLDNTKHGGPAYPYFQQL